MLFFFLIVKKPKHMYEDLTPNLSTSPPQPQNAHAQTLVKKHDWQSVILRAVPAVTVPEQSTLR